MSSETLAPHPFIYGRPVRPGEFLNRESDLRTVFNRLRNGDSTAVVGEPHIGKTSLLFQLADPNTQHTYLGGDARCLVVSLLNLHAIDSDYTPMDFWKEALEPLKEHPRHWTTAQRLEQAAESSYALRPLDRLFNHLFGKRQRLVLLLDGVHRLLFHPNFRDPTFFSQLRSLATRTGGLALVVASHLSVAEMNERGRDLLETGSPLFGHMIEVRLRSFDERTVNVLLSRIDEALSLTDRRFIRRVTGCYPFLLQTMAATLAETAGDDCQVRAAEIFYGRVYSHFNDMWRVLDDRIRTVAVVLSLVELGSRALRCDLDYSELERVDTLGAQLRHLVELGLAERVGKGWQFDQQHLCRWRGERWTIRAQAFAWWVCDRVVGGMRTGASVVGATSGRTTPKRKHLTRLREILDTHFSDGELRTICFDLDVEYNNLPGEGKADKARELIAYLERHGQIGELVETGRQLRPDVRWVSLPEPTARLSRGASVCDEWLSDKHYRLVLTQEQWDWLVSTVHASELAMQGVGGLARALFEEIREEQ